MLIWILNQHLFEILQSLKLIFIVDSLPRWFKILSGAVFSFFFFTNFCVFNMFAGNMRN